MGRFLSRFWRRPFEGKELINQMDEVGSRSLLLTGVVGFSIGIVLAMQSRGTLARFGAESFLPSMLALSVFKEIGPVLTSLVLAGRLGAGMGAELGSMKVTEQIDALVTLSTNPMKYLVAPRVLAALITVPVLVGVGDIIGIMGGYVVATETLDFNAAAYLKNTVDFLELRDIVSSLVKGAAFGTIAALMGCYYGMQSGRGAQGVGQATKSSVEAAAVLILAANFVLTGVFFSL